MIEIDQIYVLEIYWSHVDNSMCQQSANAAKSNGASSKWFPHEDCSSFKVTLPTEVS